MNDKEYNKIVCPASFKAPPQDSFRQIPTICDRFQPMQLSIQTIFVENSNHFRPIQETMTDQYWQTETLEGLKNMN